MSTNSHRPIVIITGANGGVGFGICKRLLFQLCSEQPSDAEPQPFAPTPLGEETSQPYASCDGITLIMACRSITRAESARLELLKSLDAHVVDVKTRSDYDGHAERFRKNVDIVVMRLDLADVSTVFSFADEIMAKYPYVSHLICNAGLASFIGICWPLAIKAVLSNPMVAVTSPTYYTQNKGEESVDGLGWVWQCNLFAHFVLFRALEPRLSRSPSRSKVVWMSSIEASPTYYNPEDWQCKATSHSYENTKFEIDLIATFLDRLSLQDSTHKRSRHFIAQPGVCSTSISKALIGPVLDLIKLFFFYVARFCGSPHHTIAPFKAAISAVHIILAPLVFLTFLDGNQPVRIGSQTDCAGNEHVGLTPVKEWKRFEMEAEYLLAKCNTLYEKLKDARTRSVIGN
ncbi:hypothetical protein AX14_005510 [Amanita brunnescens Koide BX004]|nr:hypothetical protein AX14_005510 [Amanita brunnescens Koide BX004]